MTRIYWIFGLLMIMVSAFSQNRIRGEVKDADTDEPLIGVNILLQGTSKGGISDYDGTFEIKVDEFPAILEFSYLGYATITQEFTAPDDRVTINMEDEGGFTLAVTEVKAQRISEKQKESPLTIESMDLLAIKETPSDNFYDGLGSLKGVDLTAASLGFKVINTRGFNSTSPVRSLQIIDGVDNQSPGLNFSLGNFLGVPELDILKVDLIVGASSAFYGPNAFNGVISMKTKDPFIQKGLSGQLKVGERNLIEGSFRWAESFKNKDGAAWFAMKVNLLAMQANDWEANNYDPVYDTRTDQSNPGGYDAVNIYGDEYQPANDLSRSLANPGLGIYHRRGYAEHELLDYDAKNFKTNVAFHFRLQPEKTFESPKLILSTSYSGGTTVYQGDNRFSLRNVKFFQHRLELQKEEHYFLRFYATHEDAGNSYDPYFTALQLQSRAKKNGQWSTDYLGYWGVNINPQITSLEGYPRPSNFIGNPKGLREAQAIFLSSITDQLFAWHEETQTAANRQNPLVTSTNFLEPGSAPFENAFQDIISKISYAEGGTRFYDKSALFHGHGEYKFKDLLPGNETNDLEITTGANGRIYTPDSRGSILLDTSGRNINTYEYGVYAGGKLSINQNKIIISASGRVDKHQNFKTVFSPAASVVYKPTANNYLRLSFSSAIRNPTLSDQYLFYNVGRAILLGNISGIENLITLESFGNYLNTINLDTLDYFDVDPIQTEKVKTFEIGYRTTIANSLWLDAEYYYSTYRDFIGYQIGIDATFDSQINFVRSLQAYRVAANAQDVVNTQGVSLGANYYFSNFALSGNYSFNKLVSQVDDPIIPAYNTPKHKFNISFSGRNLDLSWIRNVGFNINYKWIEGFLFEGSPQFTGFIPTYDLLDAQLNWTWTENHLTFKIGASNLLNNRSFQTYGGPKIGRLAYFSVLFDYLNK